MHFVIDVQKNSLYVQVIDGKRKILALPDLFELVLWVADPCLCDLECLTNRLLPCYLYIEMGTEVENVVVAEADKSLLILWAKIAFIVYILASIVEAEHMLHALVAEYLSNTHRLWQSKSQDIDRQLVWLPVLKVFCQELERDFLGYTVGCFDPNRVKLVDVRS